MSEVEAIESFYKNLSSLKDQDSTYNKGLGQVVRNEEQAKLAKNYQGVFQMDNAWRLKI